MQQDIDNFLGWADFWQMDFNPKKCQVKHFCRPNLCFNYCMGGYAPAGLILEEVEVEKDIGVLVSDTLKPSNQFGKAAKKAKSVLGQMSTSFPYRDEFVWVHLYMTYVCP